MTEGAALDLVRGALVATVTLAAPLLLVTLVVGLLVSLFQTITSLQEQTLTQIAKMFAVMACAFLMAPLALRMLAGYALRLLADLGRWKGGP